MGVEVTYRGFLLLLLSGVLLGLYVWTGSNTYLHSSIILLSLLVLARVLAETYYNIASTLELERLIPPTLEEGSPYDVALVVRNNSRIPIIGLELYDSPPQLFRVHKKPMWIAAIGGLGTALFRYRVEPRIGRHCFGRVTLILRDPLTLTYAKLQVEAHPRCVKVSPKTPSVKTLARVAASVPYMGPSTRRRGWGSSFLFIREYVEGDELRSIDWKALARLGRPMVKVYESEKALSVYIILPVTATLMQGRVGNTKFDAAIRIAATLSRYYAIRGDLVGLAVILPDGTVIPVKPARGRAVYKRIVSILSSIEPPLDSLPNRWEDYRPIVEALRRRVSLLLGRERHFIVFITDSKDLIENVRSEILPIILKNALGGAVIYLYTPLFEAEALPEAEALKTRLRFLKELFSETSQLRGKLAPYGFNVLGVGPRTPLQEIPRSIELGAERVRVWYA